MSQLLQFLDFYCCQRTCSPCEAAESRFKMHPRSRGMAMDGQSVVLLVIFQESQSE